MKKIVCLTILISIVFSFSVIKADFIKDNGAEVLSFALYKDGEKVLSSDDGGIYPVGSVSKTFTAALIMKLSEEDHIKLDTPYVNYVPEFYLEDVRYKDITVRMLLNHTSGLFGSTYKNTMLYKEKSSWNHDNFLSLIKGQRLKSTPGEFASYSNDGYTLLEILAERVTGLSFTELLHKNLDAFLGSGVLKTACELESPLEDMVNAIGSGGLYSNADTLCIFADNLNEFLKSDSLAEMTNVRSNAKPLETYGYGWDNVNAYPFSKYGIKALTKGGDTLYHHTALVYLPSLGITASCIIKGGSSIFAEAYAVNMIKDYLSGKENIEIEFYTFEKNAEGEKVPIESLSKYEGLYLSNAAQYLFTIKGDRGILKNLYTGTESHLKYLGNGTFDAVNGIIYFISINQDVYIAHQGIASLSENEKYAYGEYLGVKKNSGNQTFPEWQNRNGKSYFICDEVYNSQLYMQGISSTNVYFNGNVKDFLGYMKLEGPTYAAADISLPGIYGRDLTDLKIFKKDGIEYASAQGYTFVDSSSIPALYNGSASICTILPNGYARWFKAGGAGGKKIEVTAEGGMFALYDSKGACTYSSLNEYGEKVIPVDGYIVFAGNAGTVFNINLQ